MVVAVAAVLALLVGLGVTLAGLQLRDDSGDTSTQRRSSDERADDRADDERTDPAAPGSDGPTTAVSPGSTPATPTTQAASYSCWDGTTRPDLAGCGTPSGRKGMRWVFPGSIGDTCRRAPTDTRRAQHFNCYVPAASGNDVRVHYSQWLDWQTAVDSWARQDLASARTAYRGDFWRWNIDDPGELPFKVAVIYRSSKVPWSVTVYGATAADRDEVLGKLQLRPVRDFGGERR